MGRSGPPERTLTKRRRASGSEKREIQEKKNTGEEGMGEKKTHPYPADLATRL